MKGSTASLTSPSPSGIHLQCHSELSTPYKTATPCSLVQQHVVNQTQQDLQSRRNASRTAAVAERRHNAVIRCNRLVRVSTSHIHTTLPSPTQVYHLSAHIHLYFALLYSTLLYPTQGYKVQVPCLKAGPPCTLVWLPSAQAGTTCTEPAVIPRLRSGISSVSFLLLWISG